MLAAPSLTAIPTERWGECSRAPRGRSRCSLGLSRARTTRISVVLEIPVEALRAPCPPSLVEGHVTAHDHLPCALEQYAIPPATRRLSDHLSHNCAGREPRTASSGASAPTSCRPTPPISTRQGAPQRRIPTGSRPIPPWATGSGHKWPPPRSLPYARHQSRIRPAFPALAPCRSGQTARPYKFFAGCKGRGLPVDVLLGIQRLHVGRSELPCPVEPETLQLLARPVFQLGDLGLQHPTRIALGSDRHRHGETQTVVLHYDEKTGTSE